MHWGPKTHDYYKTGSSKFEEFERRCIMDAVLKILRELDRLEGNPNFPSSEFVTRALEQYGYLTLFVFVCPNFRPKYLATDQPELFVATEEPKTGLLWPRLPKLKTLVSDLWQLGVLQR